ncbi:MAG: tripartite tricarboxylate transporter substrate binding protein [Burkholderiales bacterium]
MKSFVRVLAATLLALCSAVASAQYPSKPVRLIVPFGAGSSTDIVARIVAQPLGQTLGQPVLVENRPGADGQIAAEHVAKSAPDGQTLLLSTNSPHSAAPHLKKKLPYDPFADFTPISFVGRYTFFIVVHPTVPAKTLADFIGHARANPGKLNYGTGNTSSIVLTGMFLAVNGLQLVHVPYKTEPTAIPDFLQGQVQLMISSYATVAPHIRDGKLRALATTLDRRSPLLPDVPAITETGMAKFPIVSWAGLFGPAKLPKDIVDRLNRDVTAILARPDVREQLTKQAFDAAGSSPDELAAFVREQYEVWGKAIRDAGIQPE